MFVTENLMPLTHVLLLVMLHLQVQVKPTSVREKIYSKSLITIWCANLCCWPIAYNVEVMETWTAQNGGDHHPLLYNSAPLEYKWLNKRGTAWSAVSHEIKVSDTGMSVELCWLTDQLPPPLWLASTLAGSPTNHVNSHYITKTPAIYILWGQVNSSSVALSSVSGLLLDAKESHCRYLQHFIWFIVQCWISLISPAHH